MQSGPGCLGIPKRQAPARSRIQVRQISGSGSSATAIPKWVNVDVNQGSAITYVPDPTFGHYFVINEPGIYAMCFTFDPVGGGQQYYGISINATAAELSLVFSSISQAHQLAGVQIADSVTGIVGTTIPCPYTGPLSANDIIRPHLPSDGSNGSGSIYFQICKVCD